MPDTPNMTKVRIYDVLLEQMDWLDLFPTEIWSRQAKVNYCARIGLSVLLLRFERECKDRPADANTIDPILRKMAIDDLILRASETTVPHSELARLVNRSLCQR
jgi:hypothetical protein